MSVDLELIGPCTWRVTARPDSGRAFWSVTVYENHKWRYSMAPVLRALRRAWKIDQAFSTEQIERRLMAKRRRLARGAKTPQEFMAAIIHTEPSTPEPSTPEPEEKK